MRARSARSTFLGRVLRAGKASALKWGPITKYSTTASPLTVVEGVPAKNWKNGPKPTRSSEARKGWAVGVPYSAATARNWLRNGAVPQRLCAAPSSRPRSHVPTHCSFSRAGSPAPLWVAGSPVAFLVTTPRWPPAAALPVWTLFFGAVPREGRHLGALKVVCCPQAQAGHVP